MKNIIIDFDSAAHPDNKYVDDGLALLYLLGNKNAKVIGITCTYGSADTETVYENTNEFLKEIKKSNIPIYKGGLKAGDYENEASEFLVKTAQKFKGNISILSTGSLTNIAGAIKKDTKFAENVNEIIIMGGMTEPIVFNEKEILEPNFSLDKEAALTVLSKHDNVSVITLNNCTEVIFTMEEYKNTLLKNKNKIGKYIFNKTEDGLSMAESEYSIGGFYFFDVTAAIYMMSPDLFFDDYCYYSLSVEDLENGYMKPATNIKREMPQDLSFLNLPKIACKLEFKKDFFNSLLSL